MGAGTPHTKIATQDARILMINSRLGTNNPALNQDRALYVVRLAANYRVRHRL